MINRCRSFDVLKGLCIILVVFCHTVHFEFIHSVFLNKVVQTLFLNTFYFVAGWVFSLQHIKNNARFWKGDAIKKITELGFPYIMLGIISILYDIIFVLILDSQYISDSYGGSEIVLRDVFCFFSLNGVGTLWFLPVLLISLILLIRIDSLIQNETNKIIWSGIISSFGFVIYKFSCNLSLETVGLMSSLIEKEIVFVQRVLVSVSYLFLGYIFEKLVRRYLHTSAKKIMFSLTLFFVWLLDYYYIGFLNWLIVVTTSIFLLAVEQTKDNKFRCMFLEYCGKNSLIIMFVHYNLFLPIIKQLLGSFVWINVMPVLLQRVILFILVLSISVLSVEIVNRNVSIQFLFGKGPKFKEMQKRILGV